MSDVPQDNRAGPPPADAVSRPGWHPRHAPFGGEAPWGNEHLTSLREEHLEMLARQTALGYARLDDGLDLQAAIAGHAHARVIASSIDVRPLPAGLALAALIALYGVAPLARALREARP